MENNRTFTTMVKEEICGLELNEEQLKYVVSGFVKTNGVLNLSSKGMELKLQSENGKIAKFIFNAFKVLFHEIPNFSYSQKMKLKKVTVYILTISHRVEEILNKLEVLEDGLPSFPVNLNKEENRRYFLSGAFLASGSVNSPTSKNYHLQFVVADEYDAKSFLKVLNRFHGDKYMEFKWIPRGTKCVLYLKRADQIATFLSIIYAHTCLLDFENERIEKDYINSDNRLQICYNANYRRSVQKGEQQIFEIQEIQKKYGNALFSEKEQKIAEARITYVDASLTQLADILNKEYQLEISRSGVHQYLEKIHHIYVEKVQNETHNGD